VEEAFKVVGKIGKHSGDSHLVTMSPKLTGTAFDRGKPALKRHSHYLPGPPASGNGPVAEVLRVSARVLTGCRSGGSQGPGIVDEEKMERSASSKCSDEGAAGGSHPRSQEPPRRTLVREGPLASHRPHGHWSQILWPARAAQHRGP
jgi:hypothetical protein